MFTKLLSFMLCWIVAGLSPANDSETGCSYYYNGSLKKNVYTSWEIEPQFPGGPAAYMRFLNKNLKVPTDTFDDVTSLPMPGINLLLTQTGN